MGVKLGGTKRHNCHEGGQACVACNLPLGRLSAHLVTALVVQDQDTGLRQAYACGVLCRADLNLWVFGHSSLFIPMSVCLLQMHPINVSC